VSVSFHVIETPFNKDSCFGRQTDSLISVQPNKIQRWKRIQSTSKPSCTWKSPLQNIANICDSVYHENRYPLKFVASHACSSTLWLYF